MACKRLNASVDTVLKRVANWLRMVSLSVGKVLIKFSTDESFNGVLSRSKGSDSGRSNGEFTKAVSYCIDIPLGPCMRQVPTSMPLVQMDSAGVCLGRPMSPLRCIGRDDVVSLDLQQVGRQAFTQL